MKATFRIANRIYQWSCISFNASSTKDFSAIKYIGKQAAAVNPALYDRSRGKGPATEVLSKKHAWFAKLDAAQPHVAYHELHIHKIVQPHASGNQVSARERQIRWAGLLCAEKFDLFSLDQSEVLTRASTFPEVPIPQNSHSTLNRDVFTLYLRRTALWADEDTFDDHRVLLTNNESVEKPDFPARDPSPSATRANPHLAAQAAFSFPKLAILPILWTRQ